MEERLQKIIARAGVASRRHAEELIASGHVTVNGRVVTELGSKADAQRDHIKVAGKLLHVTTAVTTAAFHKPPQVVSTMNDPEGRPSLAGFMRGLRSRVFPIGRLPYHASGLLLLTNDGQLANALLRAHHLPQQYAIKIKGWLNAEELRRIARATGAMLRQTATGPNAWYQATLAHARDDRLQQELARSGHPVEKLQRTMLANVELGRLRPGEHRELTAAEISALHKAAKRREGGTPPWASSDEQPRHRANSSRRRGARQRNGIPRPGRARPSRSGRAAPPHP